MTKTQLVERLEKKLVDLSRKLEDVKTYEYRGAVSVEKRGCPSYTSLGNLQTDCESVATLCVEVKLLKEMYEDEN